MNFHVSQTFGDLSGRPMIIDLTFFYISYRTMSQFSVHQKIHWKNMKRSHESFRPVWEDNLKNYTHPTIIIVLINFEGCTEVLNQQKATCLAIFGYWWFYLMKSCGHSRENILPCNPGQASNLQSDVAHLCSTCMWLLKECMKNFLHEKRVHHSVAFSGFVQLELFSPE